MLKNCKKPLKISKNRQTFRKFVENLAKLPKTINKPPKTFKNRQNYPKSVKRTFRNVQKT